MLNALSDKTKIIFRLPFSLQNELVFKTKKCENDRSNAVTILIMGIT